MARREDDASKDSWGGDDGRSATRRGLRSRHLVLAVNTDWFFLSHRLPVAQAARTAGMRVTIVAGDSGLGGEIRSRGLAFEPLPVRRRSTNPLGELGALIALRRLYRRLRPDVLHHVTPKLVIYGAFAARGLDASVVHGLSGLGYALTPGRGRAVLSWATRQLYRRALKLHRRSLTVFQNPDDRALLVGLGLVAPERTVLVRGCGVDCRQFAPSPAPPEPVVVMLPARLLLDKGVRDFVQAARWLSEHHPEPIRMVLVGGFDAGNPSALGAAEVRGWTRAGWIEHWGHRPFPDMPRTLAAAHVVVLPSWREGLPKVLLEAAATGRPVVATDVPGCREVCIPGHNGFLVPPRDPIALARAIQRLAWSRELREQYGKQGRALAESHFGVETAVAETLDVYDRALADGRRSAAGEGSRRRARQPGISTAR